MQLTNYADVALAADLRLRRLIGHDITSDLNWGSVLEGSGDHVLAAGEAALVRCRCALHGETVTSCHEHFDRLEGGDQKIICTMVIAGTAEAMEAERAALEAMQR